MPFTSEQEVHLGVLMSSCCYTLPYTEPHSGTVGHCLFYHSAGPWGRQGQDIFADSTAYRKQHCQAQKSRRWLKKTQQNKTKYKTPQSRDQKKQLWNKWPIQEKQPSPHLNLGCHLTQTKFIWVLTQETWIDYEITEISFDVQTVHLSSSQQPC